MSELRDAIRLVEASDLSEKEKAHLKIILRVYPEVGIEGVMRQFSADDLKQLRRCGVRLGSIPVLFPPWIKR